MEGDYWNRVSASYLHRELRALPGLDQLAIDGQDDTADLYTEKVVELVVIILSLHRIGDQDRLLAYNRVQYTLIAQTIE
ncbi:hypothetical protein V1519DRAFT_443746 [Lipomyces tetrasporus]